MTEPDMTPYTPEEIEEMRRLIDAETVRRVSRLQL